MKRPPAEVTKRLRELARQVREIAEDPLQEEHRRIWTAVNDCKMEKPAILARDYPWFLMQYEDELKVTLEDTFWATVELDLLQRIYEWKHLRCHRVIEPVIYCPICVTDTIFGLTPSVPDAGKLSGIEEERIKGARHFYTVIFNEKDLEKIRYPEIQYDEKETMERLAAMQEVFDGILEVKLLGKHYFSCVPWDDLLTWLGIEEGMYKFIDEPEFMHQAVSRYIEVSINRLEQYEKLGLLTSNNGNFTVGNGGYGYTAELAPATKSGIGARARDMWGDCADQLLTAMSPAMTKEFAFDHEALWAAKWGRMHYGCCERLDHKLEELKVLPGLKKISVSPFSKKEEAIEKMDKDKVVSFKPHSVNLAGDTPRFDALEKELKEVCELAIKHGKSMEILMKTINLGGEPQRLWKWCEMATQIIDSYFSTTGKTL